MLVVGGLISPSHDSYVLSKYGRGWTLSSESRGEAFRLSIEEDSCVSLFSGFFSFFFFLFLSLPFKRCRNRVGEYGLLSSEGKNCECVSGSIRSFIS